MASIDMDRAIIEIFHGKNGGVVSGEELSSKLNVSRTAIWKHVKSLKAIGYEIEAVPSQGYRLVSVPDILSPVEIEASLATERIGRRVVCVREADSTNILAFKMAEEGAEEGTTVIADCQRAGKGRMGRRWESPSGVNLYCSVILRPQILPFLAPQLTLMSAVAVARTIDSTTNLRSQIKWPNDILVNGCKVAGLLNELSAETEGVNFVILGIGVNINMERGQFPPDLRYPATSLAIEQGKAVRRLEFVRALLRSLDELYALFLRKGDGAIRDLWLERCNVLGRRIKVSGQQDGLTGVVTGVDEFGGLLVRTDDGREERILAGDVTLV